MKYDDLPIIGIIVKGHLKQQVEKMIQDSKQDKKIKHLTNDSLITVALKDGTRPEVPFKDLGKFLDEHEDNIVYDETPYKYPVIEDDTEES